MKYVLSQQRRDGSQVVWFSDATFADFCRITAKTQVKSISQPQAGQGMIARTESGAVIALYSDKNELCIISESE